MAAPDVVLELVERFAGNRAQYLDPACNETQVRREFRDSLFTALGWGVENTRHCRGAVRMRKRSNWGTVNAAMPYPGE